MLNKKLMILTIILVSLLAVSTVSAEDNATSDIISVEETDDAISIDETDEIVSVKDNKEILENERNIGTFTDLANKINSGGNEIVLDCDYRYDSTNDSDYQNGVTISQGLVIDGNGHKIDGNGEAKILRIMENNVIIKNILFTNIYSSSSDTDGAVYCNAKNVILENCTFDHISIKYGTSAISLWGTYCAVNNCKFTFNYIRTSGDIINMRGSNNYINNCTFLNNNGDCGSISTYLFGSDFFISNCSFINNSGNKYGAIACDSPNVSIVNCSFVNNSADKGGAICGATGVLTRSNFNVINCSFVNNSARIGGAIMVGLTQCSIKDCSFVNNSASSSGGSIYCTGLEGSLNNCSFVNNSASSSGGSVYWNGVDGIINNCSFVNDIAKTGGAIYWLSDYGTLFNCSFIQNSASSDKEGGAIRWNGNYGNISDCYFDNNSAYGGGAISLYGDNGSLSNCLFINNFGYGAAGAVYCNANECAITKCSFVNNSASILAGAIYISKSNSILENSTFVNNSANDGGAILIGGNNTILHLNLFDNNSAVRFGGAIYWIGLDGVLINSSFYDNYATNGGSVFWQGDDGTLNDCLFSDNYAPKNGSAVYWYGNNGNLINSTFIDNTTNNLVFWWNKENGNIIGCEFINNTNSVISNGANFIRKNVSLTYSNSSFDFKSPKVNSVYLINVLDKFPIKSQIIFSFIKGNDSNNFTIDLKNNTASICDELIDLEAGNWKVIGIFAGDSNYGPCNTTFSITIFPISSSLTVKDSNVTVGHETILISNISSNNTNVNDGVVTFYDDGYEIGSNNVVDGVASLNYAPTSAGEHTITAVYTSNNYLSSNNTAKLLVDSATVEILVENGTVGFNSTFIANVKGLYSTINEGTISFYINNEFIDKVNLVDGSASLVYTPLTADEYVVKVVFSDSVNFLDVENTTSYVVDKADSSVVIGNVNGTVGHELVLTANVVSSNNMTINEGNIVFFDGETGIGVVNVVDGVATLTYVPATDGEHTITAVYSSDNYLSSNGTGKLLVDSASVEILVEKGTVGFNSTFVANVKGLYSVVDEGTVSFYINDEFIDKVNVVDGSASLVFTPLTADEYVVKVVFSDSVNFLDVENTTSYVVDKADSSVVIGNVNGTVGHELVLTANVVSSNNMTINEGNIVFFDGETGIGVVNVVDGVASLNYTPTSEGEHTIAAVYSSNNYLSSNGTAKLLVDSASVEVLVENGTVGFNSAFAAIVIGLYSIINEGSVSFYLDDEYIGKAPVVDGSAGFNYTPLKANTHVLKAVYSDSEKFLDAENTSGYIVNKADSKIIIHNVTGTVGQSLILKSNIVSSNNLNINGGIISFFDNDEEIGAVYVKNGAASLDYTPKTAGEHKITAVYFADNYQTSNSSYNLIVNKENITIDVPPLDELSSAGSVEVKLPSDAEGNVTLTINNKDYNFAVVKGVANVVLPDLDEGNYSYMITYSGDSKYSSYSKSGEVVIKKESVGTVIVMESTFSRYANDYYAGERGEMFYGTLYDVNGKPVAGKTVQITVNGVIYDVVTDKDGKAGLAVNLAAANSYTYALLFCGDENYKASLIASSKLTVVKKPTSIIANNMAFKINAKTKTVTVALNTIKNPYDGKLYLKKGKTLTLTVNGKTYSAKTDQNGIAKFNIKIAKKGKYSATIKFDGDKTYESTSKKITISISNSPGKNKVLTGVGVGMTPANVDAGGSLNIVGDYSKYLAKENVSTSDNSQNKKDAVIYVDQKFTRVANDYSAGERGAFFYATLKDSSGKPLAGKTVQIAVNGPIYKVVTDKEGKAGLQVNLAAANTYTYALSFSGDDDYNPAKLASSKLTVTNKPTSISASNAAFNANAKTKTISVTLKTSKNPYDDKTYLKSGKLLTLKVNGKTYTAKTNAKGVAKFSIKLTKKGKFTGSITFDGDKTYGSCSKSIKITIK